MPEQYVTVVNRTHRVRATGVRRGGVVAYDWGVPEHDRTRSFVLLDDGVQIGRKAWFPPTHRDWWYCDLMSVADAADGLARLQRFLDRRLNRRYDLGRPWPDFPPAAVEALMTADLPPDWAPLG